MSGRVTLPPTQFLVYLFGTDADYEGRLVGALERIESGGALRIVDGLFVASDPSSGEIVATDFRGDGTGGNVTSLIGFRLDAASRSRATKRALDSRSGALRETIRTVGAALEPGTAVVAVLVEHRWARALEEAVSRTRGTPLASDFVEAASLADLGPRLARLVAESRR